LKILARTKTCNPRKHKKNNLKQEVVSFEILSFYLPQTNREKKLLAKISQNQEN
jgi:hypothetical protein